MSLIGNATGPKESEIALSLGRSYFGISAEEFDAEIQHYRDDELDGLVAPVYLDSQERHFVLFKAPDGDTQRFYLEDNGYRFEGDVEEIRLDDVDSILGLARREITGYLEAARRTGRIDKQLYDQASKHTLSNLSQWLKDPHIDTISPSLKKGLLKAIGDRQLEDIVNAFRGSLRFGTGGIRGMMAFDKNSIIRLKEEGLDAPILKGPNTLNEVVLLLTSAGVARFGKDQDPPFEKVVVGYDSRIRGHDLASAVAQLFLAYGYKVYCFDEPCPYPELIFAITDDLVSADVGILISASHNDYRYNGYKLSCANGSQFDPEEREAMYRNYIANANFKDIKLCPLDEAPEGMLLFLGGNKPLPDYDYRGREKHLINMHARHRDLVRSFIRMEDLERRQKASSDPLRIAYCAFHGAGRIAVPRLLREVGFTDVRPVTANGLNDLDGLFPSFCSEPGREMQPDPGDPRTARIAVAAFKQDYPAQSDDVDILIGTDPDADRCGVVVKVPQNQRELYGGRDYLLLPADDAWALLLWYRLTRDVEEYGRVRGAQEKFIVVSHTTSDTTVRVARKFDIGVVKSWVGFAGIAAATRDIWQGKVREIISLKEGRDNGTYKDLCHPFVCCCEGMDQGNRSINIGAMEQSNGFSILGGPPPDKRSRGAGGHVRDKDGTLAALLMAETAAWAKEQGTTLFELIDEKIYLDPDVGLFVNLYEPDPLDGEYPGIEGDQLKKAILLKALRSVEEVGGNSLKIGGFPVKAACIYRTGKYDRIYPPTDQFQFPDEGVRFFFDKERLDHVTCRPSGTGNSLRFHCQVHATPTESNLMATKKRLRAKAKAIMDGIRELVGAPRA